MKRILYLFALLTLVCGCNSKPESHSENYTVVVSLDAFRWDYPQIHGTPWLDSIASVGVKSVMKPSFPASTFPNHYTMATGLVPDHHGIVNNSFWDPVTEKEYSMGDRPTRDDPQYYGGEPIWITAETQGVKTGNVYWVGSDIPIKDVLPTYHMNWYDEPRLDYAGRVQETLRLLGLPEEERPRFIMMYCDDPDMMGHEFGPTSIETGIMVHYLDSLMGVLYTGIQALPYADKVNLIITSDHGMTDICPERYYCIEDYVKPEWVEHVEATTPTSFFCKEGCVDLVYNAISVIEHVKVYKHDELPEHLNYGTSERLGEVIAVPDLGWQFAHSVRGTKGAHGYDPEDADMQVIFRACGPDFKVGYENPDKFANVNLYPLFAYLLGIEPVQTDGNLENVKAILK